jgi:hypothetical protein
MGDSQTCWQWLRTWDRYHEQALCLDLEQRTRNQIASDSEAVENLGLGQRRNHRVEIEDGQTFLSSSELKRGSSRFRDSDDLSDSPDRAGHPGTDSEFYHIQTSSRAQGGQVAQARAGHEDLSQPGPRWR